MAGNVDQARSILGTPDVLTNFDVLSALLNIGFSRFTAPTGIEGLSKWISVSRLELLAVAATKPGTGQFRAFITECKKCFDEIVIWEVWNQDLIPVLLRYGFEPVNEARDGEEMRGYKWRKS